MADYWSTIDSDWEGTTRDLSTLVGLVLTEVTVSQEQHILVMYADACGITRAAVNT